MTQLTPTHCANHPTIETTLRCNRCEKYICVKCAVKIPTGYRCRECVRGQLKIFDTAEWYDYPLGFLVAAILSVIASVLTSLIGMIGLWGLFILFAAAPTAGLIISEAVRFITRRHRAKNLFLTIAIGVALGVVPMVVISLVATDLFSLLYQGVYLFLVVPTVYTRMSGIQIFKQ
jgi:hypothetical protein